MGEHKVAVMITVPATNHEASLAALENCRSLVVANRAAGKDSSKAEDKTVDHVFFYFDAVLNAVTGQYLNQQWEAFAREHEIPLIACSSLAESRAITQASPHFQLLGLSEFYSRLHHCHEVITF